MLLSDVAVALSVNSSLVSSAWRLSELHNITLNGIKLDGTGTVIVILDTAVNEEIMGTEIQVINCLPGKPKGVMDHGTICSAVAVGSPLLNDFPTGVAPGAKLIVYHIAEGGIAAIASNDAILEALQDIQNRVQNGAQVDVVSISYDCGVYLQQEIKSKIEELTELGIVFVAAVGNSAYFDGKGATPARFQSVISVGSLDKYGKESIFNSQGRTDVWAPGEDIEVYGSKFDGTSFATPAVGGLVLLLKQWANYVGSPAKDYIHCAEILRKIFSQDMVKRAENDKVDLFQPVDFFTNMTGDPTELNKIVQKYISKEITVYIYVYYVWSCNAFYLPC